MAADWFMIEVQRLLWGRISNVLVAPGAESWRRFCHCFLLFLPGEHPALSDQCYDRRHGKEAVSHRSCQRPGPFSSAHPAADQLARLSRHRPLHRPAPKRIWYVSARSNQQRLYVASGKTNRRLSSIINRSLMLLQVFFIYRHRHSQIEAFVIVPPARTFPKAATEGVKCHWQSMRSFRTSK